MISRARAWAYVCQGEAKRGSRTAGTPAFVLRTYLKITNWGRSAINVGMIRLSDEQWERIPDHFPEEHIADGILDETDPTRRVLQAVLWILNTGAQWHMLPQSYPNYKTVHRRFQTWCSNEVLRRVLTDVANELRDKGVLDEEESFIDATFAMAKGGGAEIGPTKRGKGMKIMAIVDRHGLPLSVSTHAANHHEVRLVQLCFDFYMIEAKPETLLATAPMIVIHSMMTYAKTASRWSRRTAPIAASTRRKMDADFGDMPGAGWSNGSSPGFNGSAASLSAGSFIRRTSLASCNSLASSSSSNDFEIGSSNIHEVGGSVPGTTAQMIDSRTADPVRIDIVVRKC